MTDHKLMAAFQGGDVDAYTELYNRHLKGLLNFFYRLSWDRTLAEDFTQEVLVKVFRMAREWTPQAKFTTFLYRVAKNLWIDHVRSAKVKRSGGSLDAKVSKNEADSFVQMLPDEVRPPDDDIERRETYGAIMAALEQLPGEQRMVFVLSEIEGMRYQEIGEIMDVPVGTVKSRMHSAVARLQTLLEHVSPITGRKPASDEKE